MKKICTLLLTVIFTLTLVLALGTAPTADALGGEGGSSSAFKPEIAYTNVNYTEDLTLMFAVPAPANLNEGESVKLAIWTTRRAAYNGAYSYKDTITNSSYVKSALAIEAEEDRVTIGGVPHLIYKYSGLSAEMMTDVIYARAVLVDGDNKALSYGDVLDYSIVEYVETAKGSFNGGIPVIKNAEVLALLDSMLDFGAVVQSLGYEGDAHLPNGYLANDELHKIWITPVVRGEVGEKVFGGFFKYEEGGYATVHAPFFDGYDVAGYKDAEGSTLTDANEALYEEALGFQIDAANKDIEIFVEYEYDSSLAIRGLSADVFGEGFGFNNVTEEMRGNPDILVALASKYNSVDSIALMSGIYANLSGASGVGGKNFYHGMRTVADPDNPENLLLLITATDRPVFGFASNKYLTPADYVNAGYGDTIDEAITIEVVMGKPSPDAVVNIGQMYFRNRTEGKTEEAWFNVFSVENNVVKLMSDKSVICTLPNEGLVKIAITILGSGELKAYCSDAEGNMTLVLEKDRAAFPATYASGTEYFTGNTLELAWSFGKGLGTKAAIDAGRVEIDGQTVPVMNADGTYNSVALQLFAEQNYSFILDEWNFYVGDVYK